MAWAQVKQTLHEFDGHTRFCILSCYEIVCIEIVNIPQVRWHVLYVSLASYFANELVYHYKFDLVYDGFKL